MGTAANDVDVPPSRRLSFGKAHGSPQPFSLSCIPCHHFPVSSTSSSVSELAVHTRASRRMHALVGEQCATSATARRSGARPAQARAPRSRRG